MIFRRMIYSFKQWDKDSQYTFIVLTIIAFIGMSFIIYHFTRPKHMGGLSTGPISYQEIQTYDEAKLVYPGAKVVQNFGNGEKGNSSAFYGAILTTKDSSDKIYSWYDAWMYGHAWSTFDNLMSTDWISSHGYQKGARERFIVAIENPKLLAGTLGHSLPSGSTVFEYRFTIFPAGG